MLTDATKSLITAARDPTSTEADMNAAAQAFFSVVGRGSRDDASAAVAMLSRHFDLDDFSRATFLALMCGALVERGCDPSAMAAPLTSRLAELLELSAALVHACVDRLPTADDDGHEPNEAFERIRTQVALTMPKQNAAWLALDQFWRPAIAAFSASSDARVAARPLRELAAQISDYHEGGHWLRVILSVLHNEPIVAIEPGTSLGMLGQISGIVDNFQLNTLLMDTFPKPGLLSRRRVPQRVADVARGKGPQQTEDTVTGAWNLYTWQAIQPGLTLPDPADHGTSAVWIWNEGTPEDIPAIEGRRAILLGPPSYARSWRSQRMFDGLPADVMSDRLLTKDEVRQWLQRMLAAKAAN